MEKIRYNSPEQRAALLEEKRNGGLFLVKDAREKTITGYTEPVVHVEGVQSTPEPIYEMIDFLYFDTEPLAVTDTPPPWKVKCDELEARVAALEDKLD